MSLTFHAVCVYCGRHAEIPVDGDDWNAAERWSYVAMVTHQEKDHPDEPNVRERLRRRQAVTA